MHAVSPRFLGKGDNSMMRAIPDPFLSMQRGRVPRLRLVLVLDLLHKTRNMLQIGTPANHYYYTNYY